MFYIIINQILILKENNATINDPQIVKYSVIKGHEGGEPIFKRKCRFPNAASNSESTPWK